MTWSKPLGNGYSGIAVSGGRAVTMFADGETDWLVALDVSDGEELWRWRVDTMFPKVGGADGGQNGMPVIDGGVVYGLGAAGQLFAVRLSDGKAVWTRAIDGDELGGRQPHFGFATTPLVVGDLLFVQTGGDGGRSLTGFDKATGKVLWSKGDDPVGYQSPTVATVAGKRQLIAVTNRTVVGLTTDGELLWQHEHGLVSRRDGWSTPILIGDDSFVLTGGAESAAFRLTADEDGFTLRELWRGPFLKGNFAMPVVHGGNLFGYNGEYLACVDATTGERRWKHKMDAAGLILVDDHLVLFASDGAVVAAAASAEGFAERARVQVDEKAGLTYPSFADGGIFVRNLERIARIDIGRTREQAGAKSR